MLLKDQKMMSDTLGYLLGFQDEDVLAVGGQRLLGSFDGLGQKFQPMAEDCELQAHVDHDRRDNGVVGTVEGGTRGLAEHLVHECHPVADGL